MRYLLIAVVLLFAGVSHAQISAKAISYNLTVDLKALNPSYEGSTPEVKFEVDAYYTDDKVKTIVREVGKHPENGVTIRQRLYDTGSRDEFNIDNDQRYALLKQNQVVKLKATGKQKDILGYKCKEYTFTDYRGVNVVVWVTEKLTPNICPMGNYGLKGTALEVQASNGLHYVATDFAEGELAADFFDAPQGYQQETIDLSAKKSR